MAPTIPPQLDPAAPDAMLLVRTDANAEIGVGHFMRCLALAEEWGGQVTFACPHVPDTLAQRLIRMAARVVHIASPAETAAVAASMNARYAVIDGYHLGEAHQEALAAAGVRLLVIDDRGETATRFAHVVLNQNAGATSALYAKLDATLLLGLEYALIRREFRAVARSRRATPDVARRLLISFGGADPANVTPRVIEAIAPLEGFEAIVVAGMANPRAAELRVPADAKASIRIVPYLEDMATEMQRAELAIVAAGSTCWELAACGVPMIAVEVAENQRAVTDSLRRLDLGVPLAIEGLDSTLLRSTIVAVANDQMRRARMSRSGPEVVDGRGASRVCEALRRGGRR